MDQPVILGFVGPLAAGKGTACQHFVDSHKATVFKFSTPLRDVLKRLYRDITRENMQNLSLALRQTFGDDLLAAVIAGDVKKSSISFMAVDGVRRLPDIAHLKDIPGFMLVAISADQKTRWERMVKRGENADDATKTFEEFQLDEQKEAEIHIAEVAKTASFTIDNNGTHEQLYSQIDHIIESVHGR